MSEAAESEDAGRRAMLLRDIMAHRPPCSADVYEDMSMGDLEMVAQRVREHRAWVKSLGSHPAAEAWQGLKFVIVREPQAASELERPSGQE